MQWPTDINLLASLLAAAHDIEIAGDCFPLLVIESPRLLVTHPGVNTTAARVNPEDVVVTKVVPQCCIENLDSHRGKFPALVADVGFVAACSDVVVVGQIDIEAQLLGHGLECG